MTDLVTQLDFAWPGIKYSQSLLKISLLHSFAETIFEDDGQNFHRDFNKNQFPDASETERDRIYWEMPGLVILVCLENDTKFRFILKSHTDAGDGEVVEITMHKGEILIMHGYVVHAGCDYRLANTRFDFSLKFECYLAAHHIAFSDGKDPFLF